MAFLLACRDCSDLIPMVNPEPPNEMRVSKTVIVWPKENPNPKPSFDGAMSQAQLEKKLEDYLRTSRALKASARPSPGGRAEFTLVLLLGARRCFRAAEGGNQVAVGVEDFR
jgi:hypothetical protein